MMVSEVILGVVLNSFNVLDKFHSEKAPLFRKIGWDIKLLHKS